MAFMNKADKDVKKSAETILDETFNGESRAKYDIVSFGGTLKFEEVVLGAEARGYELSEQNTSGYVTTLLFKKQPVEADESK